MTLEAWTTLAVIVGVIVVLAREMVQPAMAVLGGVIVLLILGVITPAQAFYLAFRARRRSSSPHCWCLAVQSS